MTQKQNTEHTFEWQVAEIWRTGRKRTLLSILALVVTGSVVLVATTITWRNKNSELDQKDEEIATYANLVGFTTRTQLMEFIKRSINDYEPPNWEAVFNHMAAHSDEQRDFFAARGRFVQSLVDINWAANGQYEVGLGRRVGTRDYRSPYVLRKLDHIDLGPDQETLMLSFARGNGLGAFRLVKQGDRWLLERGTLRFFIYYDHIPPGKVDEYITKHIQATNEMVRLRTEVESGSLNLDEARKEYERIFDTLNLPDAELKPPEGNDSS